MSTMNISLPESLKAFVDERVDTGDYGSSSEYVRELIRTDRDRMHLRAMILEGANSPLDGVADDAYFDELLADARARYGG